MLSPRLAGHATIAADMAISPESALLGQLEKAPRGAGKARASRATRTKAAERGREAIRARGRASRASAGSVEKQGIARQIARTLWPSWRRTSRTSGASPSAAFGRSGMLG